MRYLHLLFCPSACAAAAAACRPMRHGRRRPTHAPDLGLPPAPRPHAPPRLLISAAPHLPMAHGKLMVYGPWSMVMMGSARGDISTTGISAKRASRTHAARTHAFCENRQQPVSLRWIAVYPAIGAARQCSSAFSASRPDHIHQLGKWGGNQRYQLYTD